MVRGAFCMVRGGVVVRGARRGVWCVCVLCVVCVCVLCAVCEVCVLCGAWEALGSRLDASGELMAKGSRRRRGQRLTSESQAGNCWPEARAVDEASGSRLTFERGAAGQRLKQLTMPSAHVSDFGAETGGQKDTKPTGATRHV